MKKILIGIDDSKYAEHATAYGFDLARKLQAEVGLVHIIEPVVVNVGVADSAIGLPTDFATEYATPELMKIQSEGSENLINRMLKAHGEGVEATHFTEYGPTAQSIIDCAQTFKADMIIIGTHSRSGIDRLLMGSVAEHVVRHSTVPVLVVPMPAEEENG